MRKEEEGDLSLDPYLGGYNSANAYFVSVTFSSDPSHYEVRTFKETVRDMQDLLVTGGINTNLFHQNWQVTAVVNSMDEAK